MTTGDILEINSQRGAFTMLVAPAHATADSGASSPLALVIAVQNNLDTAQQIVVKVTGLPHQMLPQNEQQFNVPPNGMSNVSLDVALANAIGITGQYPLRVTATTAAGDVAVAQPSLTLRGTAASPPTAPPQDQQTRPMFTPTPLPATPVVAAAAAGDFELYLQPEEPKHGKEATLVISNLGAETERYGLAIGSGEEPIDLVMEQASPVSIGADSQQRLPLRLRAMDRAWLGRKRELPFSLRVSSSAGKHRTVNGNLIVPPRIGWYWLPLLLLLLIGGLFGLLNRPTETAEPTAEPIVAEPTLDSCETTTMAVYQPRVIATPVVESPTDTTTDEVITAPPPPQAIQSLQFLEMPFPIDGGNTNFGGTAEQFRQASRGAYYGGRINSFFDHYYPLYPAPSAGAVTRGREPAAAPIGGNMLLYNGELVVTGYSGHPGYDYSPFVPRTATTPLFAAADGVVEAATIHGASGAYFVRIVHQVPDEGHFMTIYWHLEPDQFYDAMVPRVGQSIRAGERVGTIGNTGWSTGHHLHFEVRFDANGDGVFSGIEKVDPFGFIPSAEFPQDPWSQSFNIIDSFGNPYSHTPLVSKYLWVHSLGYSAQIPESGGGALPNGGTGGEGEVSGCAPDNALPPGGVINFAWSPDPEPTDDLAGTGQACTLSVFDADGQPVTRFDAPIRIDVPFSADDIGDVDRDSLAVHWKPSGSTNYRPLETELQFDDSGGGVAVAYTSEPGHCALLGEPTRDLVAPKTSIIIDGDTQNGHIWWDSVSVSLVSDAPDLDYIEYSLDGGTSWQRYSEPLELAIGGVPDDDQSEELEEGFQPGEGRHLVLAAAVDRAGNVENPPLSRAILLDPSANPNPTETPTETPTNTPTTTPSSTPLPAAIVETETPLPDDPTPTNTLRPTNTNTPRPTNTNTPRPTNTNTPRPTNTNTSTSTPTPPPTEYVFSIEFSARQSEVVIGECTQLVWQATNVRQVFINEEAQPWNGSQQVCIEERSQTYTLRAVLHDGEEVTRTVTITGEFPTRTPVPPTITPSHTPTPTRTPTPSNTPTRIITITPSHTPTPTPSNTPTRPVVITPPTDTPTFTPTVTEPGTNLPLDFTVDVSWRLSNESPDTAIASVSIFATGGDGNYTYFRDEIEQPGSRFEYEWRVCQGNPVSFRVTSGDGQTVKKDTFQSPPCPMTTVPPVPTTPVPTTMPPPTTPAPPPTTPAPPSPPQLSSPPNGSSITDLDCEYTQSSIDITWNAVNDAVNYTWELYNANGGLITSGTTSGTGAGLSGLGCDSYTWRVRASNGLSSSNWSETWRFTIRLFEP